MSMEGVVIWYSRRDFQAIIWCEDSRELGIASGAADWRDPTAPIEVGDVVRFRPALSGRDRLCRDIHTVRGTTASETLRDAIGPGLPRRAKPARTLDAVTGAGPIGPRAAGRGLTRPASALSGENSGNPLLHLCVSRE